MIDNLAHRLATMLSEHQDYILRHLPLHLIESSQFNRARELLTNFAFLSAKVERVNSYSVLNDYEALLSSDALTTADAMNELRLIQRTIQLSSHIIDEDLSQFPSQLIGRLLNSGISSVQSVLSQARRLAPNVWLEPTSAALSSPESSMLRKLTGHRTSINVLSLTSDGKFCISGDREGIIKLWEVESGKNINTFRAEKHLFAIAISGDAKRAITVSSVDSSKTDKLNVWDLDSGTQLYNFSSPKYSWLASVSDDGRYAVSTSYGNRSLQIWDLMNGVNIPSFRGYSCGITSVKIVYGTYHVVLVTKDEKCRIWDIKERKTKHEFPLNSISETTLTPDRKYIVTRSGQIVHFWDANSYLEKYSIQLADSSKLVAIRQSHQDEDYVICTTSEQRVLFWDIISGRKVGEIITDTSFSDRNGYALDKVSFAINGQVFASANNNDINIWSGEPKRSNNLMTDGPSSIDSIAITPNGKYAMYISNKSMICLREIRNLTKPNLNIPKFAEQIEEKSSNESVYDQKGRYSSLSGLAISPDNKYACVASQVGTVLLWNITDQEEIVLSSQKRQVPNIMGMWEVRAVSMTPDGQHIVSSYYKDVKVWELNKVLKGKVRPKILKGHNQVVTSTAAMPDNKHIVSASYDGSVVVWNIEDGIASRTLRLSKGRQISSVAAIPIGKNIIIGTRDGGLIKWDLNEDKLLSWQAHNSRITAVKINQHGTYVVSTSEDGKLKIWSIEECELLCGYNADDGLADCAIAPDSTTIITSSNDGQLHILRLNGYPFRVDRPTSL